MSRHTHSDPPSMPHTGEQPHERLARALSLSGTPGQAYVERRRIPLAIADAAGMRFDPDWNGRPAVLIGMHDREARLVSVHGRYLETLRGQDKMFTIGAGGGVASTGAGWHGEPLILVEGIFDALSLAACGWDCVATIGRWAPWLPEVCASRTVWLAFDANAPGEDEVANYMQHLPRSATRRLLPPSHCKDWNTALLKRGQAAMARWLRESIQARDTTAR
ncbi:toprim domain-containing protein [Dyella humicola]|uniref:toprim domain-containing protein n=1 Tax=Dyella humicola TaxID=2992126 RepID=UPI0022588E08|nr:toprim domain-containing protein [Dyella humicola]